MLRYCCKDTRTYGNMMSEKSTGDQMIASMGKDPSQVDDSVKNIFTKDYRKLMKAVDKKSNQKRGI